MESNANDEKMNNYDYQNDVHLCKFGSSVVPFLQ